MKDDELQAEHDRLEAQHRASTSSSSGWNAVAVTLVQTARISTGYARSSTDCANTHASCEIHLSRLVRRW